MTQFLALGVEWRNLITGETQVQRKTQLVVGGTRTQVLADSIVNDASTLTIALLDLLLVVDLINTSYLPILTLVHIQHKMYYKVKLAGQRKTKK